jgi:hypothetical protein
MARNTYGNTTVGENTRNGYLRYLDEDRLIKTPQSLKLNVKGRQAIKRVQSNNLGVLMSRHGYIMYAHLFNDNKAPQLNTNEQKIAVNKDIRSMWRQWHERYEHLYPPEVNSIYGDYAMVSPRSIFKATTYWDVVSTYGHNGERKFKAWVRDALKDRLTATLNDFIRPMSVDLDSLWEKDDWLSHVNTGSNCGYPEFKSQVKKEKVDDSEISVFYDLAPVSKRLFQLYLDDPNAIKWHKLPFTPGARTERKLKARVIYMAPMYEKPTSAIFSYLVAENIDNWMIHMPRREGSLDNLAATMQKFYRAGGSFLAKDYDGFDTSLAMEIFDIIFEILEDIDHDFAHLLRWELDIIRKSGLLVAPDVLFKYNSLPSGVGPTQWIGTLIHDALDYVSGLTFTWVTYQSDDTSGITLMSRKEVMQSFSFQESEFGVSISPLGKKSFYGDMTIIVQMIVLPESHYGNAIRRFGNGWYRERPLNIKPELVEQLKVHVEDKSQINVLGNAMSYIGNIGSVGKYEPMFPEFVSLWYGPKSGYQWWHVDTVLPYVGQDISSDIERLVYTPQFVSDVFHTAYNKYGWRNISVDEARRVIAIV